MVTAVGAGLRLKYKRCIIGIRRGISCRYSFCMDTSEGFRMFYYSGALLVPIGS
jgi:hypothetical protein